MTFLFVRGNAQEKFASYDNSYNTKMYDIQISTKGDEDKYTFYIDAMSMDRLHDQGGILIRQKQHQDFLNALSDAKVKYIEWVKVAKENNVKELDKTMDITSKVGAYFKYGSDWEFQFLVNLRFDFKILESKGVLKYLLIVRTGELQSSSNRYMKVDGFVLVFTSASEIDNFTNLISVQKTEDFLKKPKPKDLFK